MNIRSVHGTKASVTSLLAAVATTVLTLSTVAPAHAAASHRLSADSGATIIGTVKLPNGRAATNAKVYVFLDGVSAAATPSTKIGTTVRNPLVATTSTDGSGHYALTLPEPTAAVTKAAVGSADT